MAWNGLISHYGDILNLGDVEPISICEGNTPLVFAPELSARVNANVFLKIEGANPTGSFKDRGMTVAMTMAKHNGAQRVVCASTGNTSASAAAYAARAKLPCLVLIPEGKIALGKLSQALIFGARVLQVRGNFDVALDIVRVLGEDKSYAVVNSVNPFRILGQQTGAYEICDALNAAPDFQFMPVGNAGNITAYWRGYKRYLELGKSSRTPKMHGVQASGAAPFLRGKPVENPETIATAIRIGKPASWDGAMAAVHESSGAFHEVSDEEILEAYKFLAMKEGVFCEPASAASVAGLLKYGVEAGISEGSTVVCVLTGNGLKDPDCATSVSPRPTVVDATLSAIREAIEE